jgi:molecular chaperone DnaJ
MTADNHYQILEISQTATPKEIKQAYRRLVKQFHPDTQSNTADREKTISINAAYETLSDPQRRHIYDRQLNNSDFSSRRQQRTTEAQRQYQRYRETEKATEVHLACWLKDIYMPLDRIIGCILNPLDEEIELLSADPFDDYLMESFQDYLDHCRNYLDRARQIFTSQPNPSPVAKVAASLYYCLDRLGDGIEELEFFTLNYDDRYLHTGKELFRIARQLRQEARLACRAVKASL